MDRNSSSRTIKSASAFLAVLIIVVVMVLINQKRRIDEQKEKNLKETIEFNSTYDERLDDFLKYADKKLTARNTSVEIRNQDYIRYATDEYKLAHVSMWDISALPGDGYSEMFGSNIEYADYQFETPMELKDYLESMVSTDNQISTVYINVDPASLEDNYYSALYYDENPMPFEEYIHSQIFPILDENPNVLFQFILPTRPVSYWASMEYDDYNATLDKWYVFLMYLHWCPNATASFMGDVEWLVANDYNFNSSNHMNDDVMRQVYIYLYGYEEYRLNAPELKERKWSIDRFLRKKANGEYKVADLSDRKIVFMGDSLFDYMRIDSESIPAWINLMTDANCYNFAIGGTKASAVDDIGFTKIATATAMKSTINYDGRYLREAKRFFESYDDNDSLVFVILYGMNDYFENVPIGKKYLNDKLLSDIDEKEDDYTPGFTKAETFIPSMELGIEALKAAYPEAEILVISPYTIGIMQGGKEPMVEGGRTLDEYVKAIEAVSNHEKVSYYDMYNHGLFTLENEADYLTDGIHTREGGAFLMAGDIANKISEILHDK